MVKHSLQVAYGNVCLLAGCSTSLETQSFFFRIPVKGFTHQH